MARTTMILLFFSIPCFKTILFCPSIQILSKVSTDSRPLPDSHHAFILHLLYLMDLVHKLSARGAVELNRILTKLLL